MGRKNKSPVQKSRKIMCGDTPPSGGGPEPPALGGPCTVTGPPSAAREEGTEQLHSEEASRTSTTRPRPASTGTPRVDSDAVRCHEKGARALGCFSLKPLPQTSPQKIIRQILTEGHSTKSSASTLQNCPGHRKPGVLGNRPCQEEPRKM